MSPYTRAGLREAEIPSSETMELSQTDTTLSEKAKIPSSEVPELSETEITAQNLSIILRNKPSLVRRGLAAFSGRCIDNDENKILDDVSLKIQGPSLTAIIGPSGSGKTTLLDALSCRHTATDGIIRTGQTAIRSDGLHKEEHQHKAAKRVAYVRQEDMLFPTLTVRETLQYAADLSMGSQPSAARSAAVERLIELLRLGHCADTVIGDTGNKGCSGGEIRRTSIGVQIVRDQPVLFLDEPTTGLDSKAALDIVRTLRDLADQGKTVVMTIHQPAAEIWHLIDKLVVLSQGSLLYAGSTKQSLEHFAENGLEVPAFENAFDYISDMVAVDTRDESSEASSAARLDNLRKLWEDSTQRCDPKPSQLCPDSVMVGRGDFLDFGRRLWVHCRRTLRLTIKDRLGIVASYSEALSMGLACGAIFYQVDRDIGGIRSRQGALYCTLSLQSYLVLLYETYRLTVDIKFFDRERADGLTTPAIFYLSRRAARFMVEDVLVPLIFSAAFYFMAGLRSGVTEFFAYFLVQLLLHLVGMSMAVLCVLPTREFMTASLIANINYGVQCLCAGLLINHKSFGIWVGWVRWITQLFYAFGALCSNEFSNEIFDCPWPDGAADPRCREYTGTYIMASLSLPERWFGVPIAALSGFAVLFAVLALGALCYWTPSRRPRSVPRKARSLVTAVSKPCPQRRAPVPVTIGKLTLRNGADGLLSRRKSPEFVVGPVSAHFNAGSLNAVLGPSGSGKTTLLCAIAGRIQTAGRRKQRKAGCILFNGLMVDDRDVSAICSFVPQHDAGLLPHLTAQETLYYATQLRLPKRISAEDKMKRADTVLRQMGLTHCISRVGDMSGGEKRRLSMAVQILSDPAVLVLDEPTSGLDAFTAATIIEALQLLADEGRTIIMVVHQPRWSLLERCTKLLLLSGNGQQAFFGSPKTLASCFQHSHPANPAELALERLAEELPLGSYADDAASVPVSPASSIAAGNHTKRPVLPAVLGLEQRHRLATVHVVPILLRRCVARFRHAPALMLGRVAQIVGSGVVAVLFFTPLGYNSFAVQTRIGIIAQSSALCIVGMLNALALYPADLDLFLGEFADGLYAAEAFFSYYTLIELPMELLSALLLSVLLVFATGLSEKLSVYLLITYTSFAAVNCGESLGMIFLSLIRHRGLAISVISVIGSLFIALSGAFSLNMPPWIGTLNNLSPAKWQIQVSAAASLRGMEFSCPDADPGHSSVCSVQTGEQLLQLYNLNVSTTQAACILLAVTFGYRLFAYIAIKLRCAQQPWQ